MCMCVYVCAATAVLVAVMEGPPARPLPIAPGQAAGMGTDPITCGPQPSSVTTSLCVSFAFSRILLCGKLVALEKYKITDIYSHGAFLVCPYVF